MYAFQSAVKTAEVNQYHFSNNVQKTIKLLLTVLTAG